METTPTLDCQDCGIALRRLTPSEAQRVAERPYDFVTRCGSCGKDAARDYEASR